jgi:isochorismate hydrolase
MVCGVSTSGCVRATVVDAFSNNLRVQVIEDACFDRSQASHAVNLADLNAKYADVIPSADALAAIASYPDGLFDLPTGVPTRASQGA